MIKHSISNLSVPLCFFYHNTTEIKAHSHTWCILSQFCIHIIRYFEEPERHQRGFITQHSEAREAERWYTIYRSRSPRNLENRKFCKSTISTNHLQTGPHSTQYAGYRISWYTTWYLEKRWFGISTGCRQSTAAEHSKTWYWQFCSPHSFYWERQYVVATWNWWCGDA